MNSKRRIALLLTLVFLLPVISFSVYEFSSLDRDEKMIQTIYHKQLEAILFSVNQYSDDVLGNWVARVETDLFLDTTTAENPPRIQNLLLLNESLLGIFVCAPDDTTHVDRIFEVSGDDRLDEIWPAVEKALASDGNIASLIRYKRSGFQKIEQLDLDVSGLNGVIFVVESQRGDYMISGFVIDTELFIEGNIGPRLQTIARDQFALSVVRKGTDDVIYATESTGGDSLRAEVITKDFWIFPDYALGIAASGTSLNQIVRDRTKTNLILLAGLNVVLITAVVLVFRNLRREVDLAQNKSEFISNVSHEIRTPLAVISMFAETLELNRVANEEKRQEYYRIISQETQRLSGIVNRILNFSQAETKKRVLHPETLNAGEVVQDLLRTYDFHLRNKGFDYSYAEVGKVWVRADREAMEEVMINLIDNAIKYSKESKRLEIETKTDGLYVIISFKDYGIGIALAHQQKIFDKFFRVPTGDLAKSRGTGLGLALVKQLMEAQNGKVTVESQPGKGSTFKLYFQRV